MLIATLPPVYQWELLEKIVRHPLIEAVRYNVGIASSLSAYETLKKIKELCDECGKVLWVDLKGRQLRITNWAAPYYGEIELNHRFMVDLPARIVFRGDDICEIRAIEDSVVYVDPSPRYAVGAGQAVNIIGSNLQIEDYLTEIDSEYIDAAHKLGLYNFMLSFVEGFEHIHEVDELLGAYRDFDAEIRYGLKIETPKGLDFILGTNQILFDDRDITVIAARDDLMINIGDNKADMLAALRRLVARFPSAIVASRIFMGIEHNGQPGLADFADLALMEQYGYQSFMLSDGICYRHFDEAMQAWTDFQKSKS